MEAREIYTLSCRLERCEDALIDFAHNLGEVDEDASRICLRMEAVTWQRKAYDETRSALARLPEEMREGYAEAAERSYYSWAFKPESIMQRELRISVIHDAVGLRRWQTWHFQEFKRRYAHALHTIRAARLANPNRFQLRHHWRNRKDIISTKGDHS